MGDGPKAGAKWSKYTVNEDGTLTRNAEFCPECGPGVFMAAHKDRKSCGRCGYTTTLE
jgi:small subunit ribosomal protein S27Ae